MKYYITFYIIILLLILLFFYSNNKTTSSLISEEANPIRDVETIKGMDYTITINERERKNNIKLSQKYFLVYITIKILIVLIVFILI